MDAAVDATSADTDPLLRHFSGKRRRERVPNVQEVRLVGSAGPVRGRTVDVSDGGALVEVLEDSFVAAAHEARAATCVALADRHFRGGVRVEFVSGIDDRVVRVDADLLRLTVGPDAKEGVRAACRFVRPLTGLQRMLIGLDEPVTDGRRLVPRHGAMPQLLLFATVGPSTGPLCAARVVAIDGRLVMAQANAPAADAATLADRLGSGALRAAVLQAGSRVWEIGARALDVRAEGSAALIELAADEGPVPAVTRFFRPA